MTATDRRRYIAMSDVEPQLESPPEAARVRLKLVLWGLYEVSLVTGTFGAKFRITLFWSPKSDLSKVPIKNSRSEVWKASRDEASLTITDEATGEVLRIDEEIPPISLLNAKVFSVDGKAEVHAIQPQPGGRYLMRWTCMYTATLTQSNLFQSPERGGLVSFPYDSHVVEIQLGVQFGCVPCGVCIGTLNERRTRVRACACPPHMVLRLSAHLSSAVAARRRPFRDVVMGPALDTDLVNSRKGQPAWGHIEKIVALPEFELDELQLKFEQGELGGQDVAPDVVRHIYKFKMWRKHFYFQANILVLNAVLSLMSFACFALTPKELPARLSAAFSLLFGIVSLRFVVNTDLPRLEFNTFIQKQLNLSIYILFGIVFESSVMYIITRCAE